MTKESLENAKKRISFRAWHRGTQEMDLLLGSFVDKEIPKAKEEDIAAFEAIIDISDAELYALRMATLKGEDIKTEMPLLDLFLQHQYVFDDK